MDKLTIKKIIQKDERATLGLYNQYKKPIFHFILRQLNDYHIAEELTQDVFMDFLEGVRDFRFQSSIKTYLFSIARNKVIDVIRKKKIKKILFSMLPSYVIEGLKSIIMDDEIEKKELEKKISHVFKKLPNDYEVVLRLKYIDGVKVGEVAQKLSMRFKAAESLIFRARKAFVHIFNKLP